MTYYGYLDKKLTLTDKKVLTLKTRNWLECDCYVKQRTMLATPLQLALAFSLLCAWFNMVWLQKWMQDTERM